MCCELWLRRGGAIFFQHKIHQSGGKGYWSKKMNQQLSTVTIKDWTEKLSRGENWERGDGGGCLVMSSLGIWVEQMRMNQSLLQTGSWIDEKNGETGWEGEREGRIGESVIVSTDKWWQNLGAGCHFGTIRTDVPGGVQQEKGNRLPGLQHFPS